MRALGGVRELHKIVLKAVGELVDVLTSSMTSQGRKAVIVCVRQRLKASPPFRNLCSGGSLGAACFKKPPRRLQDAS